ncbi:MAG: DNA translocase FtsK, partial [bacterium]
AAGLAAAFCGLLLALAAQTAGLGPTGVREGLFDPEFFSRHGGGIGEVFYWATVTLFQRLGSHILAVGLMLAGLLLILDRSLLDLGSIARRGASRARQATSELATAVRDTRAVDPDLVDTNPNDTDPLFGPPEPIDEEPTVIVPEINATDDEEGSFANFDEGVRVADEQVGGDGEGEASTDEIAEVNDGDEPSSEVLVEVARGSGQQERSSESPGLTPRGERRGGYTQSEDIDYTVPSADLLEKGKPEKQLDGADHEAVGTALLETLGHFGIEARMLGVVSGPHVSRYEIQLAPGTKVGKITQLKDDLAYALASTDIRILAPIPGKQAVGVEVPNQRRRLVRLGDIYGGRPEGSSPMVAWLGKDIAGHSVWTDLQKMPHVLVAGTTGSGKSGCVNAILSSLLLHASPNELRLVLVDPKQVELNHYERVPHLLTPVVTSPRLAANVLNNLIAEMESRYQVMSEARARNLDELNQARRSEGEPPLPYILCVIDELADLMMVAPTEVEDAIIRLAQKSRAVGIHLLLATQRPSTDIITGTIKVNIPARIAFSVSSQVDSRVILDQGGAETLLGQGDMLFRPAGTSKMQRIQGAFVTEDEISEVTGHWSKQGEPVFEQSLLELPEPSQDEATGDEDFDPDQDDLLGQAAQVVVESGTASVSMIQRRLRVGYTRAGRLIDMLERRGIISGYEGSKPRQVLVGAADLPSLLGSGPDSAATDTELVDGEVATAVTDEAD